MVLTELFSVVHWNRLIHKLSITGKGLGTTFGLFQLSIMSRSVLGHHNLPAKCNVIIHVARSTGLGSTCLEPITTNGALVHSNRSVIQLLLYDVITSLLNMPKYIIHISKVYLSPIRAHTPIKAHPEIFNIHSSKLKSNVVYFFLNL